MLAIVETRSLFPIFRIRGCQASCSVEFGLKCSNSYMLPLFIATPPGDHGFRAFKTVVTCLPVVIFTTQPQPVAAA